MKILVGSVFLSDSPLQQRWLGLQLRYLYATTKDFDHVVCITGEYSGHFGKKTRVIEIERARRVGMTRHHATGLAALVSYFRENASDYDAFLLLDSDAFPINKRWVEILHDEIGKFKRELACPIRFENLEQRLHTCALFITKEALSAVVLEPAVLSQNLLHDDEYGACLVSHENERGKVFPLLRSNQTNIHQVACAVYFNLFYHHSAGTRAGRRDRFTLRSDNYWGSMRYEHRIQFRERLFKDPTGFINRLAGWTPNDYPDIEPV